MKQFSYCVDGEHTLASCLSEFQQICPEEFSSILLFVFTSNANSNAIWNMMEEIQNKVPKATIAGLTSSGEIMSGNLHLHTTVLNFMVFENTRINIFAYDFSRIRPDDAGSVLLGQCRLYPDLVSVGIFGTPKSCNAKPFFNMLDQLPPNTVTVDGS